MLKRCYLMVLRGCFLTNVNGSSPFPMSFQDTFSGIFMQLLLFCFCILCIYSSHNLIINSEFYYTLTFWDFEKYVYKSIEYVSWILFISTILKRIFWHSFIVTCLDLTFIIFFISYFSGFQSFA